MTKKNEKYRMLLENLPDAFTYFRVILDEEGEPVNYVVEDINRAFERMTDLSIDEVVGRNLSEVLQEMDELDLDWIYTYGKQLLDGESVRLEQYFKTLNKWYEVTAYSTSPGYFAVIFCDITERKEVEEKLQLQFEFEKLCSNISSLFVRLPSEQVDYVVNSALELTGKFFQVDRCLLFQFSTDKKEISISHEWCEKGIESKKAKIQAFPEDKLPRWLKQVEKEDYVCITNIINFLSEEELKIHKLIFNDTKSVLCIPMLKSEALYGFFTFETVERSKAWTEHQIILLKVVGELISNALARHTADEKIRYLSFHDSLTGLYNRAYMEEAMERLNTARQLPISLIMADLNGLKLVNDTYGHGTGDDMLRRAGEIIRKSCRTEDIIARWGGDEFLILLPQTCVKEAEKICLRIAANCRDVYVKRVPISMALGVASKHVAEMDISGVLKTAEDNMYRHKSEESSSMKKAFFDAFMKTIEEKTLLPKDHTLVMQDIASKIGREIGLPRAELERLNLLISVHDIGIINIPGEILTKKGGLTEKEWEIIKEHPEIGFRIAKLMEDLSSVANEILHHHERWDGSGYPRGLKEKEIPLLSRITAVADAYEAMFSGRPYKEPLSQKEIVSEFKKCAGKQFDPEIVEVLMNYLEDLELDNSSSYK